METSEEIINKAIERFKELEHKNLDWRSFYTGYLEAQAEQLALLRVSCQRQQLDCKYKWQSVFHNNKLIGRYCPECDKLIAD